MKKMDAVNTIELLKSHKRNLESNVLPAFEEDVRSARILFHLAKQDLSRTFEEEFVDLRFNKGSYDYDKQAVKRAINYLSNVLKEFEIGKTLSCDSQ